MLKENNKGMTLTELIVATILIGIVMTGVATFSFVIKTIQDSTSFATILNARTAATMSHIVANGSLAIGWANDPGVRVEGWVPDPGPVWDPADIPADPTAVQWIAFRQDADGTPINYDGDEWYIYIRHLPGDSTAGNDYTLRFCTMSAADWTAAGEEPDELGAGSCSVSNSLILSSNIIDTSFDLNIDDNGSEPQFFIEIELATEWLAGSGNTNPMENPTYQLLTRITPASHSW